MLDGNETYYGEEREKGKGRRDASGESTKGSIQKSSHASGDDAKLRVTDYQ